MSLKPGIDSEATSCGIHAGYILDIADLLQCLLDSVVPMEVVQVLPDKCMRLDSSISIYLRHVHIINEVDQLLGSRRSVVPPGFLLQWFLHDLLEHEGVGVVVEWNGGHQCLVRV